MYRSNAIRLTNIYWESLKHLNSEIKMRLIAKLSASMTCDEDVADGTNATEEFLAKFSGAWKGDESAEEIIATISQHKSTSSPVAFD